MFHVKYNLIRVCVLFSVCCVTTSRRVHTCQVLTKIVYPIKLLPLCVISQLCNYLGTKLCFKLYYYLVISVTKWGWKACMTPTTRLCLNDLIKVKRYFPQYYFLPRGSFLCIAYSNLTSQHIVYDSFSSLSPSELLFDA